jgi:hypothetical protein
MVVSGSGYPDGKSRYCRRLGHPVPFRYCRLTDGERPCPSILGCWGEDTEVRPFAEEIFSQAEITPRQDKAVQLFELIKKAREAV